MWKCSHSLSVLFYVHHLTRVRMFENGMWVCHQRWWWWCDVSKKSHMQVFTCVLDWMKLWFMELGTIELFVCMQVANCGKVQFCEYIQMIAPMQCQNCGSPHRVGLQRCICPTCTVSISLVLLSLCYITIKLVIYSVPTIGIILLVV
jgi:predicted metal-binding protein